MILFFRKFRQKTLNISRFGKYLLYAIGEIILVVIGILIALQINNWNEERKSKIKEYTYLEGIKVDLESDVEYIKYLLPQNKIRIQDYSRLDSIVQLNSDKIFEIEFAEIFLLSEQINTLYPRVGSYSSLISENSAGLISNKELLQRIKFIYENYYVRISLLGQELDDISTKIRWERRLDFRQKLAGYNFHDFAALFADLGEMNLNVHKFNNRLISLLEMLNIIIVQIELELDNK